MVNVIMKQFGTGWIGYVRYGTVNTYAVCGTFGAVLKNIELEVNGVRYL